MVLPATLADGVGGNGKLSCGFNDISISSRGPRPCRARIDAQERQRAMLLPRAGDHAVNERLTDSPLKTWRTRDWCPHRWRRRRMASSRRPPGYLVRPSSDPRCSHQGRRTRTEALHARNRHEYRPEQRRSTSPATGEHLDAASPWQPPRMITNRAWGEVSRSNPPHTPSGCVGGMAASSPHQRGHPTQQQGVTS